MKYIFFGSPRFATIVLERLIDAFLPPAALVCNPDRPVGRKQIITPPPTKELLVSRSENIPIFQPEKLASSLANELRVMNPDFFVVAAYAQIIPETILEVPRLGTLGVHPSLLPKYRGASPIQSAILAGEAQTGSSIYIMDARMDHGAVLVQEALPIAPDETYDSLEMRLANLSGGLLAQIIPDFMGGKAPLKVQDETQATFTNKFQTQDGFVDPADLALAEQGDAEKSIAIFRKIRAFTPEPGAWSSKDGKRMKLIQAKLDGQKLVLQIVQMEGEKPRILS